MLEVQLRPSSADEGSRIPNVGAVLTGDDVKVLLNDPATFVLTHHIFSKSAWVLKDLYGSVPAELHDLLDTLIGKLCERKVAEVSDGKLISSRRYFFAFDSGHLLKFLPNIFQVGVQAVLNEKPDVPGRRVDYLAIPNTDKSAKAMREAALEYLAKLRMIQAEAMASPEAEGAPVRFVGLLSNVLNLKEFV